MSKYLEDIVQEELPKGFRLKQALRERLDNPLTRHPVLSGVGAFLLFQYLRTKIPEFSDRRILGLNVFFSGYVGYMTYTVSGLVKEYILNRELKKPVHGVYQWFLNNPKPAALISAICGSVIAYQGEFGMLDLTNLEPRDLAVRCGVVSGVSAEVTSRSLKNLRRLKKGRKEIEKNRKTKHETLTQKAERAYNFVFENPWILPAYTFMTEFSDFYYRRTMHARVHPPHESSLSGRILTDIINHPATLVSIGVQSLPIPLMFFGGMIALSSVLHTYSIKEHYLRISKNWNLAIGKKDRAIEIQRELTKFPNSIESRIESIVELGNMYSDLGYEEQAFHEYRRAIKLFEKKSDHLVYSDLFRKIPGITTLNRWYKKLKSRNRKKEINYMFIDLLNRDERALDHIKNLVDADPRNTSLLYIYGQALGILGYKESGRKQKEKAVEIKLEEGVKLKIIPGSKNTVIVFDEPLLRQEVIAKHGAVEYLEREEKTTRRAKEILKDFDNYNVPTPIGIMNHQGLDYYVMEFASGELLADRIKEGKTTREELEDSAEFMALLHRNLETKDSEKKTLPERDYKKSIIEKLSAAQIPVQVIKRIENNLDAPLESLEGILRVCNLDSHPRNRIIDEFGGIVGIDLEVDRVIPVTMDTANLLDQTTKISYDEKEHILDVHLNALKIDVDRNLYHLAYLNSVIVRALEIYPQNKERPDVQQDSLTNAQNALRKIKELHTEYYTKHSTKYETLEEAIAEIKEI